MAYPRRRYFNHVHFRRLFPVTAGAILLLFALLSFFAPPPVDLIYHRHHSRSRSHILRDNIVHDESVADTTFNVRTDGQVLDRDLWTSRTSSLYHGCSNSSKCFAKAEFVTHPNRYLLIATSGGLNQQRTGITDAVVAARILNATLVVPKLDQKSFWKDTSTFSEIFNVDWFISFLSKDVKILKQLPKAGGKRGRPLMPYTMRVPRKCSPRCYQNRVLPVLMKKHAVQLTKFDYRLSNKLETDLQKLRCRVNYHALKFTDPILEMGQKLIHRMRSRSEHYIALHLRFEPDMLAFSGCYYGGGEKETRELGVLRKRWRTLHVRNPDRERRQGKCPLTPEEVGLMLRGLGYGNDVHIYVASGEVYGGEETLAPLRKLFPNFHSKDSMATDEELRPFSSFSSRMAALDFIVCNQSDVFVTNNNGNMARILAGQRRYFGHMRTIRPNAKKLYRLFSRRENSSWEAFSSKVRTFQRGFMGEPEEVRPGRGEFHENPSSCICKTRTSKVSDSFVQTPNDYVVNEDANDGDNDDANDGDNDDGMFNATRLDDEPELEEMLSD